MIRRRSASLPFLLAALVALPGTAEAQPAQPQPAQPQPAQPSTPPSDEQDKVNLQCEADYEDAQRAQNADHLLEAKEKYAKCSNDACPKSVRGECVKTLADITNALPTVVFDAVDGDGVQVVATHVSVDGKEVATSIDGHAIAIDPGQHKVRFESQGRKPVELDVAILDGQQHRALQGRFTEKTETANEHPFGAAPWIVAGSGLAILGVGIGVLVPGQINIGKADGQCTGRKCPNQAAVDHGNQGIAMATAGKVLIPVGAVALGSGLVWQFLFNNKKGAPKVSFDVGPHCTAFSANIPF